MVPPPLIFANAAAVIDEVASTFHRCGYLQNTASSLSAGHNIIGRLHKFAKHERQRYIFTTCSPCQHMEQRIGISC